MRFREKFILIMLCLCILILELLYVYLGGELAEDNVIYANLKTAISEQEAVNDDLEAQILTRKSLAIIEQEAKDKGFVPMGKPFVVKSSEK